MALQLIAARMLRMCMNCSWMVTVPFTGNVHILLMNCWRIILQQMKWIVHELCFPELLMIYSRAVFHEVALTYSWNILQYMHAMFKSYSWIVQEPWFNNNSGIVFHDLFMNSSGTAFPWICRSHVRKFMNCSWTATVPFNVQILLMIFSWIFCIKLTWTIEEQFINCGSWIAHHLF
jgi:hypothetical protein